MDEKIGIFQKQKLNNKTEETYFKTMEFHITRYNLYYLQVQKDVS